MSTLVPLGDQAVLLTFEREVDAFHCADRLRRTPPAWMFDIVCSYFTVAVFFDADAVRFDTVANYLNGLTSGEASAFAGVGTLHSIPCCYERELDLKRVCEWTGLSVNEVIELHTTTVFQVFAIGFCPGFPYLGYLPERLQGVPRLNSPRLRVEPGSVGLTAKQTGLYPLARPGGWNIVGRTPLVLVDLESGYFPLRVGDRVQFVRIDEQRYRELEGERLV